MTDLVCPRITSSMPATREARGWHDSAINVDNRSGQASVDFARKMRPAKGRNPEVVGRYASPDPGRLAAFGGWLAGPFSGVPGAVALASYPQPREAIGPGPDLLQQGGGADHAVLGVPRPDDLQPDRQLLPAPADRNRHRRMSVTLNGCV